MPDDSGQAAVCATALRAAAARGAPHEKTLYYRVQATLSGQGRSGPLTPAVAALASLAGQIGDRLEDDAIPAADLPFWRDIAERVAAVLDVIATDDGAAMIAIAELTRQLHPPAALH